MIIIGTLTNSLLVVKVRICVSAVWMQSYKKKKKNQVHGHGGERLQLFLKNKTKIFLVFRITTTVFHLAPFVYVCAGANVFVGLCVWLSSLRAPPLPSRTLPFSFSPFSTLWTPCPAAEWHSNNEWCFCSRRLYWLWALWASLSFILLGDYFEIKEKVDVTWEFLCFSVSLIGV